MMKKQKNDPPNIDLFTNWEKCSKSSVYFSAEFFIQFSSSLCNNLIKTNSQNVTTQMVDFERRLCAKTQLLYIINTFYAC